MFSHCLSLPRGARRYLLLIALNEPLLFSWYLLPYMLLAQGYSVLDIGLLYAAMSSGALLCAPYLGGSLPPATFAPRWPP